MNFRKHLKATGFIIATCLLASVLPAQEERPTNGGVLRLVSGWHWCESDALRSDATTVSMSLADLRAASKGLVGFFERPTRPESCDRLVWKSFRAPTEWSGRPVWFTYDAQRLASANIAEVLINGQRLPIRLPKDDQTRDASAGSSTGESSHEVVSWFVDVRENLRFDRANVVAFRIRTWPVRANAGAWLYSPPRKERVLFLQSAGLSTRANEMIERYAEHVGRHFFVEPLRRTQSFQTANELREHLRQALSSDAISGAVLIGNHPVLGARFEGQDGTEEDPEPKEPKAQIRFYEELDMPFFGPNEEGIIDKSAAPECLSTEIWTSWIRVVPEREDLFEPFLKKILDFYEGRLHYPGRGLVIPWGSEDWRKQVKTGLDHFDRFMRPSDFTIETAHGGTSHRGKGPLWQTPAELALTLYPGTVVFRLGGCSAGNICRPGITPGEAYILGRSVGQAVLTHTRPHGGAISSVPEDAYEELLRICPHLGPFYTYLFDVRAQNRDYHFSLIMLGNPFVSWQRDFSAPSARVAGRVVIESGEPAHGFYVSATRDGKPFGRVKTQPDGSYTLECLPPGRYEVRLHVNALEQTARTVVLAAQQTEVLDWRIGPLWRIEGTVRNRDGRPDKWGWAQMSAHNEPDEFERNDLFGIRTDQEGRFALVGARPLDFWLRGRVGKRDAGRTPLKFSMTPGQHRRDVELHCGRMRRATPSHLAVEDLLRSEHRVNLPLSRDENLHALADITAICIAVVRSDQAIPTSRGRAEVTRIARSVHCLRLAFQLAKPFTDTPTGSSPSYQWNIASGSRQLRRRAKTILPRNADFVIRIANTKGSERTWTSQLSSTHAGAPDFWVSEPSVIDDWVVLDAWGTPKTTALDWRAVLATRAQSNDGIQSEKTPLSGWYRVSASLGATPRLSVTKSTE